MYHPVLLFIEMTIKLEKHKLGLKIIQNKK